jgi:fructuronate reductase
VTEPSSTEALSITTLQRVPEALRPAVDPSGLAVGIVHLGVGAFHRAHQAVYTETAAARSGQDCWGICGVSQRSPGAADALTAQDGLYSVLTLGPDGSTVRVIGSLRRALFARRDADQLTTLLADPGVRVVTLTVTEKGYRFSSGTRRLHTDDPDVLADSQGRPPVTAIGQLARGLERRRRAGSGPISIVSCDNIPANGKLVGQLLADMFSRPEARFDPGLAEWSSDHTRFPSTMVDRIVPAATEQWAQEAARMLTVHDRCAVAAEPFTQWVIEDDFASGRPQWELAGAELVPDVAPYESLKLRTLNGTHSALAYLGLLAGSLTVADALERPGFEDFVRTMMDAEVMPTLQLPAQADFGQYRDTVLGRFANPRLPYRCSQVAMDGSQKLPQRLLGTVRDNLARGQVPEFGVTVVAAWLRCIATGADDSGRPFDVDDPLADDLRSAMGPSPDARQSVAGALSFSEVFGEDLPADQRFRRALSERFDALARNGAQSVVSDMASNSR